jgi:tetratricopeptide (TPR) repeat protein
VDLTTLGGSVAVVAVLREPAHGVGDARPTAELGVRVRGLAEQLRGHVLADDDDCLAVFSNAGRALDFAVRVHGEVAEIVGVGAHVGEVHPREGGLAGPAVRVARALAEHAQPGETLVSRVVHDIVRGSGEVALVEVDGGRDGLGGLAPAYAAHPAGADATHVRVAADPPARLVERLQSAVSSARLTTMIAGPGMGKTVLARAVAEMHPTVWLSVPPAGMRPAVFARALVDGLRIRVPGIPAMLSELAGGFETPDPDEQRSRAETLAASVAESLADRLPRDLVLVVDGIDRLASWPVCLTLLEAMARNSPADLHLLLLGRRNPGLRTERLGAAGRAQTIDEEELRLSDDEVAELVRRQLPPSHGPDRVAHIVRLAAGHPETALLGAAHARVSDGTQPENATDLVRAVIRNRPDPDRAVLQALAALGEGSAAVLAQVTGLKAIDVDPLVADGLVRPVATGTEPFELGAATATIVDVDEDERRRYRVSAARELRLAGDPAGALDMLRGAEAPEYVAGILREEGRRLLAHGSWPTVLDAVGEHADDPTMWGEGRPLGSDPDHAALVGEAWRLAGDRDQALAWFHTASDALDPVPAWLAWRMGMLLHFGGELDQARSLYARADGGGVTTDLALLRSWEAAAAWLQSDIEACRVAAAEATQLARESGDDEALSAAHTAQALLAAVEGDRAGNDQHYLRALVHAERAGDVLQLVRIHTNRGSRLLEEGDHAEALAELELALRTADLTSAKSLHGMGLNNRGQVLRRLGRLDEATADLVASRAIFERTGSRWVGYALAELGEIYDIRGERSQAIACHEEAIAQCEPVGDTQGTVPAYAGLARLVVTEDPDRAKRLVELACAQPDSLGFVIALAAAAEVAFALGDLDAAARAVQRGLEVARQRRDRPGVATHLELHARLSDEPVRAREYLLEARDLWARMHCPLEEARTTVALATIDPTPEARRDANRAVQTLRSLGARSWAEEAQRRLAEVESDRAAPIQVDVLGSLAIHVGGRPLVASELPLPDAIELLAFVITRSLSVGGRGGPVSGATTALWPDDPGKDERFEAARTELEAFLARHGAPDAISPALTVDSTSVDSDIGAFLAAAREGLDAYRAGGFVEADERLAVAESRYGGVLLDGHPPAAWLAVARDDAAEVYLQVVMALVNLAEDRDDNHGVVRLLLRVIERDPYDEGAHLRLVACLERAGRRGESRRRYRNYTARMQEIGLEPAPFPDVTPTVRASQPASAR